jgi:hypothetical protein
MNSSSFESRETMPKRKTIDKSYQDITKEIDLKTLQESVRTFFSQFPDPRNINRIVYPAWYLILIILCGYLSGCNTIAEIASFAEMKNTWFCNLLGIEMKAVSYDTIWWFLVRVEPQAFKS